MNDGKDKLKIWQFFTFKINLTLKTIGILTKLFCSCGPNLVILAWTRDKLSRGQASAYRTHRQTDAANDNTRRPKLASGKNCFRSLSVVFFRKVCPSGIMLHTYHLLSLAKARVTILLFNQGSNTCNTCACMCVCMCAVRSCFPSFTATVCVNWKIHSKLPPHLVGYSDLIY